MHARTRRTVLGASPHGVTDKTMPMLCERGDDQQQLLASLRRRAAAGQIDRRRFLLLAAAIGVEPAFAAAAADQAPAASAPRGLGERGIAASYDYIIVG